MVLPLLMPSLLPTNISNLLPVGSFVLCCFSFNLLGNMDKALVESTILINLQEFPRSKIEIDQEKQRRLSAEASTSIQNAVDKDQTNLSDISPLTNSLSNTFSTFTEESLLEALEYFQPDEIEDEEAFRSAWDIVVALYGVEATKQAQRSNDPSFNVRSSVVRLLLHFDFLVSGICN